MIRFDDVSRIHRKVTEYAEFLTKEIVDKRGRVELISINTEEDYQRQKFGKRVLDHLKEFCVLNHYTQIYGEIHQTTPIGVDNLTRFYKQNGFEVKNNRFWFDVLKDQSYSGKIG